MPIMRRPEHWATCLESFILDDCSFTQQWPALFEVACWVPGCSGLADPPLLWLLCRGIPWRGQCLCLWGLTGTLARILVLGGSHWPWSPANQDNISHLISFLQERLSKDAKCQVNNAIQRAACNTANKFQTGMKYSRKLFSRFLSKGSDMRANMRAGKESE